MINEYILRFLIKTIMEWLLVYLYEVSDEWLFDLFDMSTTVFIS